MQTTTIERRRSRSSRGESTPGVVIGRLAGLTESNQPLVEFPGNSRQAPVAARSTVSWRPEDVGREVALLFEQGDPSRPLLIGPIVDPARVSAVETSALSATLGDTIQVESNGERLTLTAKREIVLRCGKATVILTRAGKVLIRGAYLLSRSSGVNRVKGGSVQIN